MTTQSQPDLATQLEAIREMLFEARRYTRGVTFANCGACRETINRAIGDIQYFYIDHREYEETCVRVVHNLAVGLEAVPVDPRVVEGYIDGARHELACIAGWVERAATKGGEGERS